MKDKISDMYGKLMEYDYFIITKQITKIAEKFNCPVISVLEGGYNVEGCELSTFATSVYNHLNGFILKTNELLDPRLLKRPAEEGDLNETASKRIKGESDEGELDISIDE